MTNLIFKRGRVVLAVLALCGPGFAQADPDSYVEMPASQAQGVAQTAQMPPAPDASVPPSPCRPITTQAQIDGMTQTINGFACPQADGSWQMSADPYDFDLDSGASYPVYPDYATYPGYYAYDPWLWYSPVVFGFGGSFVFVDNFNHFHSFHHPYYGYASRAFRYQRVGARGYGGHGFGYRPFGGRGFGGGGFGRR
jgi:hypothetical protein